MPPRNRIPNRNQRQQNPNMSDDSDDEEEKTFIEWIKSCTWKQVLSFVVIIAFLCCVAINILYSLRSTYPVQPQRALCAIFEEEKTPFLVPCKGAESHNKGLLKHIVANAADFRTESMATQTVTYLLALSMRTRDTELARMLYDWIRDMALTKIECTQLINFRDIDFTKEAPQSICAAANYLSDDVTDHTRALAEFNLYCDIAFLMGMFGSEFHEVAMRYTTDAYLVHNGEAVKTPFYAGWTDSFYAQDRGNYMDILKHFLTRVIEVEDERMGSYQLTRGLQKALMVMRRCNPPVGITWMEYAMRAAFKRKDIYGEDDCRWAYEEVTFTEKAPQLGWDLWIKFKKMTGKI